jgi:hypothetical protein
MGLREAGYGDFSSYSNRFKQHSARRDHSRFSPIGKARIGLTIEPFELPPARSRLPSATGDWNEA